MGNRREEPRDSLANVYLAGVELRRRRLGDQEREEVLGAWKAGFKARELTIPRSSSNDDGGDEHV